MPLFNSSLVLRARVWVGNMAVCASRVGRERWYAGGSDAGAGAEAETRLRFSARSSSISSGLRVWAGSAKTSSSGERPWMNGRGSGSATGASSMVYCEFSQIRFFLPCRSFFRGNMYSFPYLVIFGRVNVIVLPAFDLVVDFISPVGV